VWYTGIYRSFRALVITDKTSSHRSEQNIETDWMKNTYYRSRGGGGGGDVHNLHYVEAVPWLRRLVAAISLRRPGFAPGQSLWDLCWTKWQWDRFFSPRSLVSPVSIIPPWLSTLISSSSGECPLVVAVQRHKLTPSTLTTQQHYGAASFSRSLDSLKSKKIPSLIWITMVHYHVHESPPVAPVLIQMN
jgi:hypothetical protein